MMPATAAILADLLHEAGLPAAVSVRKITGRGLDNEIHVARLADGRDVILRRWAQRQGPELSRARFLEQHGVPTPRLLAATTDSSLYDFAPGVVLGDLIEMGGDTERTWRMLGSSYRRVHGVRFPAGLSGELHPREIVLRPVDPVAQMHTWIDECVPGLKRLLPETLEHLPELHDLVDGGAEPLRKTTTSLLHGDVNMWNVVVDDNQAWLVDWDFPRVGDPAMEVALLDKHASLFNSVGLGSAFFDGYGRPAPEPNTSLHRVVQTMHWAASSDWALFEKMDLPGGWHERTRGWLKVLLAHVAEMPRHIEGLRKLM